MRIIAGIARGRQILAPKGMDTRPTLDRVKESLFGILQFRLAGSRVLDLFAGSGNLGLEALSRGAAFVVFNDHAKNCCTVIEDNLSKLQFSSKAMVYQLDYNVLLSRLQGGEPFDLVFLDPPYADGAQKAAERLFSEGLVAEDGLVIVEHDCNQPPYAVPGLMQIRDSRKYGYVGISILEREGEQN